MANRYWFMVGLLLGLFWGAILVCLTAPIASGGINELDKATAIYECKNHYGVYDVSRLGYITCKDNYRPKYITEANDDVYMLYKVIESRTYFGITFMDWKNYKSSLNK
jgi:hypothetical protein